MNRMILYDSEKVICVFMSDYCVQGTVLDAGDKETNVGRSSCLEKGIQQRECLIVRKKTASVVAVD